MKAQLCLMQSTRIFGSNPFFIQVPGAVGMTSIACGAFHNMSLSRPSISASGQKLYSQVYT
jgi:hypothetical protein